MCTAHGKQIKSWFRNQDTIDFILALAEHLKLEIPQHLELETKRENSPFSTIARVSAAFPSLVTVKSGSPENGGGTWVHPDLAIKLAAWCSKPFEIEVIHWVKEWLILSYSKTRRDTYSYGERVLRLCMSDITITSYGTLLYCRRGVTSSKRRMNSTAPSLQRHIVI